MSARAKRLTILISAAALIILITGLSAYANPIGNIIPSVVSTAAETGHVVKTGPANLYGFQVTTGGSAGYVMFFDSATIVANGAVTPKLCYVVAANSTLGASFVNLPATFANGIVAEFSTTGCFTETQSATAFFSVQGQ